MQALPIAPGFTLGKCVCQRVKKATPFKVDMSAKQTAALTNQMEILNVLRILARRQLMWLTHG
jgi:hypothetical protein